MFDILKPCLSNYVFFIFISDKRLSLSLNTYFSLDILYGVVPCVKIKTFHPVSKEQENFLRHKLRRNFVFTTISFIPEFLKPSLEFKCFKEYFVLQNSNTPSFTFPANNNVHFITICFKRTGK